MKTLFQRWATSCLCAAALTLTATVAPAGNGSLFATDSGLFNAPTLAALHVENSPRPTPLLHTGDAPAKVDDPLAPETDDVLLLAGTGSAPHERYSEHDLECMAEAIYHEARGESTRGQAAVAEVILNRVESRKFPPSVCGVVNQPSQFSYTIGGRKTINNKAAYLQARDIARNALGGAPRALTGGATYYHTPAVSPSWSHRFRRTVQIGQHIFYRPDTQRIASN